MKTTRAGLRSVERIGIAMALAALLSGCGTTTGTYETSWLRSFTHKAASFDSGGKVTTYVQIRKSSGWMDLPGASNAIALRGGKRAVVRNEDGTLVIVDDQQRVVPLPSCTNRSAQVSPDREWVLCFEQGLFVMGFSGDALVLYQSTEQPDRSTLCRLIVMYRDGRVISDTQTVPDRSDCSEKSWTPFLARLGISEFGLRNERMLGVSI
jgi:hypothetical protein